MSVSWPVLGREHRKAWAYFFGTVKVQADFAIGFQNRQSYLAEVLDPLLADRKSVV